MPWHWTHELYRWALQRSHKVAWLVCRAKQRIQIFLRKILFQVYLMAWSRIGSYWDHHRLLKPTPARLRRFRMMDKVCHDKSICCNKSCHEVLRTPGSRQSRHSLKESLLVRALGSKNSISSRLFITCFFFFFSSSFVCSFLYLLPSVACVSTYFHV